jgi:hypothetical protein
VSGDTEYDLTDGGNSHVYRQHFGRLSKLSKLRIVVRVNLAIIVAHMSKRLFLLRHCGQFDK